MLQRLPIGLTQVKTGNTSENLLSEICKSCIIFIKEKNYERSIQQYNEFNKFIKYNGYYVYEF